MSNIILKENNELMNLIHADNTKLDIPKPFQREIYLFSTYVAGTSFIDNMNEVSKNLNGGDKLVFFREPNNEYDNKAIVIKTEGGDKIGYVPKSDNPVFARLMDAGKVLFGRIKYVRQESELYYKIRIRIYLED